MLVVCAGMPVAAQPPPHPAGPLGGLLGPRPHARPPAKGAEPTPEVFLDAATLGSPILLDKSWRVGITANQAAATPEFDDSAWDIRNASDAIAEVPDEDRPPGPPGPDGAPARPPDQLPMGHQRPFVWFRTHIKLAP